jgi:hypothetical protein
LSYKAIKKETEQALQIIGNVIAKSYAHKLSMHGRRHFVVSFIINHISWILNVGIIIVHFIIMEKIYKINEQHFTFVRMDNLPALFPNTTPLVRRLSVKCQWNVNFKTTMLMLTLKKSFLFRQSLRTFPVIVSNNNPRISGKMSFTIEAFIINNFRLTMPNKNFLSNGWN